MWVCVFFGRTAAKNAALYSSQRALRCGSQCWPHLSRRFCWAPRGLGSTGAAVQPGRTGAGQALLPICWALRGLGHTSEPHVSLQTLRGGLSLAQTRLCGSWKGQGLSCDGPGPAQSSRYNGLCCVSTDGSALKSGQMHSRSQVITIWIVWSPL